MKITNWKMRRILRKKVRQNQKARPITLKNVFKQTGIKSGGRDRYRELVRIRDEHTCQLCDKKWENGKRRFDIHHIKGNYELTRKCDRNFNNQITLCHSCHLQVDGWKISVSEKVKEHIYKMKQEYLPRNNEIKELRESGLTLQKIGDKYGISRERVRQVLLK